MFEITHDHMLAEQCGERPCADLRYNDGVHHFVGALVVTWPVE